MDNERRVCSWAAGHPLYLHYHDYEWGVPLTDDNKLFELLVLEGMQAGLSWLTILLRRDALRTAFAGFDPVLVSRFTREDIDRLMHNPDIIRNNLKIRAAVSNANAFLELQARESSFASWLWQYVDYRQQINNWRSEDQIPASTELSTRMSKDMKKLGFSFVGPTICYAFMQSAGLVWDHITCCDRWHEHAGYIHLQIKDRERVIE